MNYQKIYNDIIKKAQDEQRQKGKIYYESHHILPKCLGGTDQKENLVLLTGREHFICHWLLIKIHQIDPTNHLKMLRAFIMMASKNPKQKIRYMNSRVYDSVKQELYGTNGKLSGENGTFYGKTHSIETRQLLSEKHMGQHNPMYGKIPWNKGLTKDSSDIILNATENRKKSGGYQGIPHNEKTKEKLSKIAKQNGFGKDTLTKEQRQALSETIKRKYENDSEFREKMLANAMKGADKIRGVPQVKIQCPHCNKIGGISPMKRWHFDNCKERKNHNE